MEILQFIQKLNGPQPQEIKIENEMETSQIADLESQKPSQKVQANFEFRRLNILLLRGVVGKDGNECARKIATATASDSRINLSLSTCLEQN